MTTQERLYNALLAIVKAWESVPENMQVPDEINDDELWDNARDALCRADSMLDLPDLFDNVE